MPAETDFAPPSGLAQLAPGVEVTATCPSATGARRALTVRRLARRPHLYHLRNALSAAEVADRNHYWDKKETPRFGEMMSRYEHHSAFYQRLEGSCELDFKIARKEHCDADGRD